VAYSLEEKVFRQAKREKRPLYARLASLTSEKLFFKVPAQTVPENREEET
jgi:hypothetical protein